MRRALRDWHNRFERKAGKGSVRINFGSRAKIQNKNKREREREDVVSRASMRRRGERQLSQGNAIHNTQMCCSLPRLEGECRLHNKTSSGRTMVVMSPRSSCRIAGETLHWTVLRGKAHLGGLYRTFNGTPSMFGAIQTILVSRGHGGR